VARGKGVLGVCLGCVWWFLVSDTGQVELKSGQVWAPAVRYRGSSCRLALATGMLSALYQGLTLVHSLVRLKRHLWKKGVHLGVV